MTDFERLVPGDWGFEYKANRNGQIFRLHKNQWIEVKGYKARKGYALKLKEANGKLREYQKRRVVYETFNGKVPDGFVIVSISDSNRLSSLRAVRKSEFVIKTATKANQKPVVLIDEEEMIVNSWPSASAAGRDLHVTPSGIQYICNTKTKDGAVMVAWENMSDLLLGDAFEYEKKRALRLKEKRERRVQDGE